MKKRTKVSSFLGVLFCILFVGLQCNVWAWNGTTGIDVVMVLDKSDSMNRADEQRVSQEGAKLFVDMLEVTGSRAGVVSFNEKTDESYSLTEMRTKEDKEKLKSRINYGYGGDTDMGTALKKGLEMLDEAGDVGNKKMLLLFTDGANDFDITDPQNNAARTAKANNLSHEAIADAQKAGIPIYTIGLNGDGKVDTSLITEMADETGAECEIVQYASQLPDIFNNIFADAIKSEIESLGVIKITDPDNFSWQRFEIPNSSVLEANIVMMTNTSGGIKEIELKNPAGDTLQPDGSKIIWSTSNSYSTLKILNPEAGDWEIGIKGQQGCEIHLNLIYNYDIVLEADLEEMPSGEGVLITASLMENGTVVTDSDLYNLMTTQANITWSNGTTTSQKMDLNSQNEYECNLIIPKGEKVSVVVHSEGANMYRDSRELVWPNQGIPSTIILEGIIPSMAKKSLNLEGYWGAKTPIGYSAVLLDDSIGNCQINDSEAKFVGKRNGRTEIEITAFDDNGNEYSQNIILIVNATFDTILPLILIGVGIILCIVLIIVIIKIIGGSDGKGKNGPLRGYLYWSTSLNGRSSGREQDCVLDMYGKSVRLMEISSDSDLIEFDLNNIIISGKKNGIQITNKSKNCILKDQFDGEHKVIGLSSGEQCSVECKSADEGSEAIIWIRYGMEEA